MQLGKKSFWPQKPLYEKLLRKRENRRATTEVDDWRDVNEYITVKVSYGTAHM